MGSNWNDNPRKVIDKHPSCVEVGECRPAHRGGKHTRHWCKGRVGIPHTWEWVRQRDDLAREQHMHLTYNRITEVPVCFGCEKIDSRYRHYCGLCGEPWPELHHELAARHWVVKTCAGCGAPYLVRHAPRIGQWSPSGSVVR
jgi:hypothetical protein